MAQMVVLSRKAGVRAIGARNGARRNAARLALALAVLGCLSAAGCLFTPREAEPPESGTIVRYLDQISPAAAWDNLETSAEATHAPGWETAISPTSFLYIPDSESERLFPGAFVDWNRDREVAFINTFYNTGISIVAVMKNPDFVVPPSSGTVSIWENVIYDMTVTSPPPELSRVRYRGSAIITFSLEGNFWYITEWRDQQGESDPDTQQLLSTLGVLRGNFASK